MKRDWHWTETWLRALGKYTFVYYKQDFSVSFSPSHVHFFPFSSLFPLHGSLSWFSVILAQPLGDCRVTGLAAGSRLAAMSERHSGCFPSSLCSHFQLHPFPNHLKGNQRLSEREKYINIFFFEKRVYLSYSLIKCPNRSCLFKFFFFFFKFVIASPLLLKLFT